MKPQRLTFSQLHEELEVFERESLRIIKGGVAATGDIAFSEWLSMQLGMTAISSMDTNGNWVVSVDGGSTWMPLVFQLEAVTITGHGSFDRPSMFTSSFDGFGVSWADSYGATYGGSGSGGSGSGGGGNGALITSGSAGSQLLDIAGLMLSSLGLSATFAQASSTALSLESAAAFATTSTYFVVADIALNLVEIFATEQTANQRLEDLGQIGVAVTLIFVANPVGLVAGGIALAAWELYEYNRDHSGSGGIE